jgi:hypothetical protein
MYRNKSDVASEDIRKMVQGYMQFVEQYVGDGFEPYLISFMFKMRMMNSRVLSEQIRGEIERVFKRFITEVVREPRAKRNKHNRPILIGCPDWPVPKSLKKQILIHLPWEGVHAGGVLLIPPVNRLKRSVKDHFEEHRRHVYIRRDLPLSRIFVQYIGSDPGYVMDYALKSLKKRRCAPDELFLLA